MTHASSSDSETTSGSSPRSGARVLVDALNAEGVEVIFGYPGGAIMPVYDQLRDAEAKHILCRHEQAAAIAANAYGRVTRKAGVCMATSGPGATNLITGIADAFLDSAPMVAITGQVATSAMGTDAFQEVDIFGITLPIVKHSFLLRESGEIESTVFEAFEIAETGRPGPVLIDLPKDVTLESVTSATPRPPRPPRTPADDTQLARAEWLMNAAERPLIYAGAGIAMADAVEEFRGLVERSRIPVVETLKALGSVHCDHPDFVGMLGMHGNAAANMAVQECDLLIVIGARFDDRATGRLDSFAPNAKVIHFDADPAEISKLRPADVGLNGDLKENLRRLCDGPIGTQAWRDICQTRRKAHAPRYDAPGDFIYAPALLRDLSIAAGENHIVTCDVGQHQMWVAQHWQIAHPRAHLTSGGLGTMGFGIPAAIGAKYARPDATVICVTGDGSIMMNIQELATLKRYDIDVKIVLLDNQALGMVRQWQELFFDENYSEVDLSDNPDFAEVARAFGVEAFTLQDREDVADGIERLLATEGPCLMHVPIDKQANVWPLVPPGKSNAEMMMESEQ
ncbi:MAG: acetolactate synthase 2 catalytic subunit [Pseudomonadota bacterium]